MYDKSNKCFFCGNVLQKPAESNNESSIVECFCAICGIFEATVSKFSNIMKNMFASYLFYNVERYPTPFDTVIQKPFLITTEEYINKATKEYLERHVIVTADDVEKWFPQTDEERIDKILVGLSTRPEYDDGVIVLSTEQLYSAFLVERYNSEEYINFTRLPDAELQEQVEWVYDLLGEHGFLAGSTSKFSDGKIKNRHNISLKWEGQKRVKLLRDG
jgi:hypothetical protein